MTHERLSRDDRAAIQRGTRHEIILAAALQEAQAVGYQNIIRHRVAARAGVANGSVNHAFGTLAALKNAVMEKAVEDGVADVVAQGLATGHPVARNAPAHIKEAATRALA